MPFTAQELSNIGNSALDYYLDRKKSAKQNIQNKPMLVAFDASAGNFPGGKGNVSLAVKGGQGGGSLQGYTHDDLVRYYNPASNKRVNYPWHEHHIGIGVTHTELKNDGITVTEDGGEQTTSEKTDREWQALNNIFDDKLDDMDEDYKVSWDTLIHGDGTADPKSIAGIRSLVLDAPTLGSTGGLSRGAINPWWQNRAATAANATAGGQGPITVNAAGGGALLTFMQKEWRQLGRFAQGGTKLRYFCGTDFIGGVEQELRANGNYTLNGFTKAGTNDGSMASVTWQGKPLEYDPMLDTLGLSKRMYVLDMRRIRLMYMEGEKMKKASPTRPYDRYVMYKGLTSTAVMIAQQLNTSGVYDIA